MRSFTLTILAILCATTLFAQSSPAVKGRVVDAVTGKAIEYADVIITDAQNNTIASAWVRDGVFSIDRVRDGEYVLTVMLVGLVNSGIMALEQTVGVIFGSNIGTTLTAWILSLAGIEGGGNIFLELLKPKNFSPIVALRKYCPGSLFWFSSL